MGITSLEDIQLTVVELKPIPREPNESDRRYLEVLGISEVLDDLRDFECAITYTNMFKKTITAKWRDSKDGGIVHAEWATDSGNCYLTVEYQYAEHECEKQYGEGDYSSTDLRAVVCDESTGAWVTFAQVVEMMNSWFDSREKALSVLAE